MSQGTKARREINSAEEKLCFQTTALQRGFTASIIIGNKVRDVETRAASVCTEIFVIGNAVKKKERKKEKRTVSRNRTVHTPLTPFRNRCYRFLVAPATRRNTLITTLP